MKASTGPPRVQVQRRFETNRLARDFQARAYQEVMPLVRRAKTEVATAIKVVAVAERGVPQKGVAA